MEWYIDTGLPGGLCCVVSGLEKLLVRFGVNHFFRAANFVEHTFIWKMSKLKI